MFPCPCGAEFAEAVRNGADPKLVVPDGFVIVRGGVNVLNPSAGPFSGAAGPTRESAAAAVPHGQIRVTTAGAIRAQGGIVEWVPELSRYGTPNQQHVNITEGGPTTFSELCLNPVPRTQRIDGDKR
jgi:hypothetical protein